MNQKLFRHISPLTARAVRAWHHVSAPVAFLVALIIGLTSFGLFARAEVSAGPARVAVAAVPSLPGRTVLTAPPFGSVSARTHAAPIRLEASLREVDVPRLQAMAKAGLPDAKTVAEVRSRVQGGAWKALLKGLLAAAAASAFVGWSLRHRLWVLLASTALGVLVPAVFVAWTALAFDAGAFQHPSYEGALTYAPSLVQLAEERVGTVENAREGITEFTRELAAYYASPQSFGSGGAMDGTFRVLHVSDLHMDPVGQQLQRDLVRRFKVGLVVNTGDSITYGSGVEAHVAAESSTPTGVPVVYVAGNHDSPALVSAMHAVGATVLDSSEVEIAGIRIFGVPDPLSRSTDFVPNPREAALAGTNAATTLRARLASGETTPQIVAVHEPETARPLLGISQVLLEGHTHTPALDEKDGTWELNAGTTGGVHFSKLRVDPHIPHSAAILYYTEALPRRLIAIDQIEVDSSSERFSLRRTVVDPSLLPAIARD